MNSCQRPVLQMWFLISNVIQHLLLVSLLFLSCTAQAAITSSTSEIKFERIGTYGEGIKEFIQISHYVVLYQGHDLCVLDVKDPAHPQLRATFPGGGQNMLFKVMGNYLLVQVFDNRETSYKVYDFKDPLDVTPRIQGERYHGSDNLGDYGIFATDGNRLFQIDRVDEDDEGNRRVAIRDLTTSPTTLAWRTIPEGKACSLLVRDSKLMAVDSASSTTIPLANFGRSANIWTYEYESGTSVEQGDPVKTAKPAKVTVKNTVQGLKIYENFAGSPPILHSIYGAHPGARQFKIAGKRGYLIDGDGGLQVLDMSDPTRPRCLGRYAAITSPDLLAVEDDLVFLGGKDPGFRVLDCSRPDAPKLRGQYRKSAGPMSIQGKRAYVAAGKNGLQILDISNPAAIRPLGRYPTSKPATDIATSGSLVYILAGDLLILDTAIPAKAILLGKTPLVFEEDEYASQNKNEPLQLKKLGPALYVIQVVQTKNGNGMETTCKVIDVSNPAQPRPLPRQIYATSEADYYSEKRTEGRMVSLSAVVPSPFNGWYLCLPRHDYHQRSFDTIDESQLAIYDLSNPLNPILANCYDEVGGAVALYKNTLYLANGVDGLIIMRPVKR